MLARMSIIVLCWCVFSIAAESSTHAAAQFESVTIGYSSFSGAYGPLWVAVEGQLGKKYGLDIKAIYAGRIRPQQLLASGEVPYVVATGTGALTSHILGVKDQVIVLTFINKVDSALFTKPEIKSVEQLRGKTIATGRPGAFADTMVRYVLRAKLGLTPDKDVQLLPMGEAALTFPALEKGVVEAASLTMPYTLIAKKMGFWELIDYNKAGVVYPYTTVTTLRQTAAKNPELLERILKTMVEGIYVFRTDKQRSMTVLKKYMRGAGDDILEETYDQTRPGIEEVPTPSVEVIKGALEILAHQYPQAKQADPTQVIDARAMQRLEQSGFIKALYMK